MVTVVAIIGFLFINGIIELDQNDIEKSIQDISTELPKIEEIQTIATEKINEITANVNTQIDSVSNQSKDETSWDDVKEWNVTHGEERIQRDEAQKRINEQYQQEIPLKIHELINEERTARGLQPLLWNPIFGRIALEHSIDMAKRSYFDHNTPEGYDFTWRYSRIGFECSIPISTYEYSGGGENIMYFEGHSYSDLLASKTVNGWMESSGHRENILTPYFQSEGIGIDISAGGGKIYVTQNFC